VNQDQSFTFAVVGHDEEDTLGRALGHVRAAARPGDEAWFVDSASTDESLSRATTAGVRIIEAPLGKGRAVAAAIAECRTDWLCTIDGDILHASQNIPARLRDAAETVGGGLVVGEFDDASPSVMSNTVGVYEPLIRALFPEAAGLFGRKPLTGFRAWRTSLVLGPLPPDFGIEAHINITSVLSGVPITVVPIGSYRGPFRYKPTMGFEIARPVLDIAVASGRLLASCRPAWDRWVADVVEHVASYHGDPAHRDEYVTALMRLAGRPFPAAS